MSLEHGYDSQSADPLFAPHIDALRRDSGFAAPVARKQDELMHPLSPLQIGKTTDYMSDGSQQTTRYIGLNLLGLVNLKFKIGHETTIGPEVRVKVPGLVDVGGSLPVITDEMGIRISPQAHGYALGDQFGGKAAVGCGLGAATGCGVEAGAKAGPVGEATVSGSAALVKDGEDAVKLAVNGHGQAEALGTVGGSGIGGLDIDRHGAGIRAAAGAHVLDARIGTGVNLNTDRPNAFLDLSDQRGTLSIDLNPTPGMKRVEVISDRSVVASTAPITVDQSQIFEPEPPPVKVPWWKQGTGSVPRRDDSVQSP